MARSLRRHRKWKVDGLIRNSHRRWAHQQDAINYSSPPDRCASVTIPPILEALKVEGEAGLLVPDADSGSESMQIRTRQWAGWWYAERWNGETWGTLYSNPNRYKVDEFLEGYTRKDRE